MQIDHGFAALKFFEDRFQDMVSDSQASSIHQCRHRRFLQAGVSSRPGQRSRCSYPAARKGSLSELRGTRA